MKIFKNIEGLKCGNAEFQDVYNMSRKDAIIYIANKYKIRILKEEFLKNNIDYNRIANDFGLRKEKLYFFFSEILHILDLNHRFNKWDYYVSEWNPYNTGDKKYEKTNEDIKRKKKRMERKKERDLRKMAYYYVSDVWRLLAYYCLFFDRKVAKRVLRKLEYFQKKKYWKKIREMFTPLFFDGDFGGKILKAKILYLLKKGIYSGEIYTKNIKKDEEYQRLFNEKCIIFSQKELKMGDYVIGIKKNPEKNKIFVS